jgi:ATP-dependent Clp protease ATP-binding subunit ClpA
LTDPPALVNLLTQAVQDSQGCFDFLSANLGTEALSPDKRPIGFVQSATPSYAEARALVMHEVKRFFKPESLNRLDDVIVFPYLEPKDRPPDLITKIQ